MLAIHGGGWRDRRGDARQGMIGQNLSFRAQHWRVINIAYSEPARLGQSNPDARGTLRDVVAFYDQIRRAFDGPICAVGPSAGGHLAAMLAVERPSLTCAVPQAPPLDLRAMLKTSSPLGRRVVTDAFGTNPDTLSFFSPTLRWDDDITTRIFVVGADNDSLVAPEQIRGFGEADPDATVKILPGATPGGRASAGFIHSAVQRAPNQAMLGELGSWLDAIVPVPAATLPDSAGVGSEPGVACDAALPVADWAADSRDDRWKLLRARGAWVPQSSPSAPVLATSGCSGSGFWQDDGLSMWAFPQSGTTVPAGTFSAFAYSGPPGETLHTLTARFRAFLARPSDWNVGLFASDEETGTIASPVAACIRARCRGLKMTEAFGGGLISSPDGARDPDAVDEPALRRFDLPAGTRRLAWRLECAAPAGCSLDGIGGDRRKRDPLGHPAILSLYSLSIG